MKERRFIVDTTLRDGEQSPFINFTPKHKIELAKRLDDIGIHQIEAGVVAIGATEQNTICKIMEQRKNAEISVWSRLHLDDVRRAIECEPDLVHISIPVSYLHIYKKLVKNKVWIIKRLGEILDIIAQADCRLSIGLEDATRAEVAFILKILSVIEPYGERVKMVRIADTVGGSAPFMTRDTIKEIRKHSEIDLEIHAHNDLGMATSNTMEALKMGALYADTTILGIGERTGNCDMRKLLRLSSRNYDCGIDIEQVAELEAYFTELINRK